MFHDAGEAIRDLFRHERITIIDETGKKVTKVVKPEPLQNPIKLLRMLTWKACKCVKLPDSISVRWPVKLTVIRTGLFYVVALASWTVDGYDCQYPRKPT